MLLCQCNCRRGALPPLPPGETAKAAYRLPTNRRGRFRIGPLAVSASDPFGLARRTLNYLTDRHQFIRRAGWFGEPPT